MVALKELMVVSRAALVEWFGLRWHDLEFASTPAALRMLLVVLATSLLLLLVRSVRSQQARRRPVVLPAILSIMGRSSLSWFRHVAFLVFLAGVPFFAVALADPHTGLTREEVSRPGRRIALLVDASTSMVMKFNSAQLHTQDNRAFFTAVSAAERFVKLRMNGPYRDVIALIQFGNEAFVVTPFTTDFENILLSLNLIGEPREWGRFGDWGTTILQGIDEGTQLFKAFDFIHAEGNVMLIFSDGRDWVDELKGRKVEAILDEAARHKIRVYMVRTAFNMKFGEVREDKFWKAAVERTGGRFYPAADEDAILHALDEVDRLSPGRIDVREYRTERPQYSGFALIAIALWLLAAALQLGFRGFRTFP